MRWAGERVQLPAKPVAARVSILVAPVPQPGLSGTGHGLYARESLLRSPRWCHVALRMKVLSERVLAVVLC